MLCSKKVRADTHFDTKKKKKVEWFEWWQELFGKSINKIHHRVDEKGSRLLTRFKVLFKFSSTN